MPFFVRRTRSSEFNDEEFFTKRTGEEIEEVSSQKTFFFDSKMKKNGGNLNLFMKDKDVFDFPSIYLTVWVDIS